MQSLEDRIEEISNLIDQSKLDEAQVMINSILEQNPGSLLLKRQQMRIYKRQEKWVDLEKFALQTLKLFPDDLRTAGQLINAYIAQEKLQKAETLAKKILQKEHNVIELRNQLVTIYKKQRNWYEVERTLKQILDIEPNDLPARYQLMVMYKIQKRWDELGKLAHEVQSLDPDNVKCRRYLKFYKKEEEISATEEESIPELNPIQLFRQRLYNGEITHENLNVSLDEILGLTDIQRTILLAEVYTYFNIPENAIKYLKQGLKQQGISEREAKLLKQSLELAKSTKASSIARRKRFEGLNLEEDR